MGKLFFTNSLNLGKFSSFLIIPKSDTPSVFCDLKPIIPFFYAEY